MLAENVLEMKNIDKSFSGTQALKGINFSLEKGEVHALLGENGAGKSTLIKTIGGIHQPDKGDIYIEGKKERIDGVNKARELGIGIIHQEIVLVPFLDVVDNIFLGREILTKTGLKNKNEMSRQTKEMIASLGLSIDIHQLVGELNIAQQQMIEIVKAVSFNAKILVMDEPTSSLSEEEVVKLFEIIDVLRKQQVSIIYISHRMEELFKMTDRITVIRDGSYIGTRVTKESTVDELVSMMVGRSLDSFYVRTDSIQENVLLSVKNLTKKNTFNNVSFSVKKGEILGFSGLVGAGRSEIMEAIFGATSYDSGEVYLEDRLVRFKNPQQAINSGVALVPEDRKKQGLVLIKSVGFNLTLASLNEYLQVGIINEKRRKQTINDYVAKLHVKTATIDSDVGSLSGGNQQKVVLAKWLATHPKLLILDEPTRGVDVGAKQEIYTVINELAKTGLSIILVSSDLPEIINMCDNVCVVRNGAIVKQLDKTDVSQETIMKYATGG